MLGLDWMQGGPGEAGPRLAERVAEFERSVIAGAIAAHRGHLRAVYESLGISRKTLYEKMQKHGLDAPPSDRRARGGRRLTRPMGGNPPIPLSAIVPLSTHPPAPVGDFPTVPQVPVCRCRRPQASMDPNRSA